MIILQKPRLISRRETSVLRVLVLSSSFTDEPGSNIFAKLVLRVCWSFSSESVEGPAEELPGVGLGEREREVLVDHEDGTS